MRSAHAPSRGMSFVDVIVGVALFALIFYALFGVLRASIMVSAVSKQEGVASSIAEAQMEYVRSLAYDSVGTVGGIPAGVVPQYATSTLNGTTYVTHTFIDYVDDPADGLGAADSNGITTDYKRIKVTVSYVAAHLSRSIVMESNYAPISIETTTGGGTLKIVVVNATGAAVPGATVQIVNNSTSPAVNLTTYADATGVVYLPGAATSTDYQVTVSKAGYSSAQTYARDATNQNPTPGYLTVVKNQTTTSTFAIDQLATLNVATLSPIATTTFTDTFSSSANVSVSTNVSVGGGQIVLSGGGSPAGYAVSGQALSTAQSPTYLAAWTEATSTISSPPGTGIVLHVVDGSGNLLPDAVLPGNAAGFTDPIDLSGVSTTTYPALGLRADLATVSTTSTPVLTGWALVYQRGPVPYPNVPFTLTGAKTIGSTGAGAPIYKTTTNATTDGTGASTLSLEWDSYLLSVANHDVVDACVAPPYLVAPASTVSSAVFLGAPTTNALLVTAVNSAGTAVPGATVTLSRTGYSRTVTTSSCGGAYFGSLTSASDYTVTVSKAGYTTDTNTNVSVSGQSFFTDSL